MLEKILEGSGVSVCVQDLRGEILYQNSPCVSICGGRVGLLDPAFCRKRCLRHYVSDPRIPAQNEGTQSHSDRRIGGSFFDVVFLKTGTSLVTILHPVGDRGQAEVRLLAAAGLSRREVEIAALIVRDVPNTEIARRLGIAKSTLKTHLNNIYRKVPGGSSTLGRRSQRLDRRRLAG